MAVETSVLMKIILVASLVVGALVVRYVIVPRWGHDTKLEEYIEEKIKDEIGVDMDITPESPEQ